MAQQWRIKITEKQRKEVDRALLLQAVIALAKHLEKKRREEAAIEEGRGDES
jgi:ribosomal protein S15P/S13E